MPEISSSRPIPPLPPARPSASSAELMVKLLEPLGTLLAPGKTAEAQVLTLKATEQSFQLLLKLTLENGTQATLKALSPKALAQGTSVLVTALTDNKLLIANPAASNKALTSIDLDLLPIGTLVQGKVVASEQIVQAKTAQVLNRLLVNLLNTPLSGRQISVDSPQPLPVGSLLTAEVKGQQALNFLPLSGRVDQLALGQQLTSQSSQQGSLGGLLNALHSQLGKASDNLSPDLRNQINKLMGQLPEPQQLTNPKNVAKAIENSGVFLEARLLTPQTTHPPQDLKASLLKLIVQLLPAHSPSAAIGAAITANAAGTMAAALPSFVRNALGNLAQSSQRQQGLSFPLHSRLLNLEGEADLETLLRLAAAAVSRLQTHQLASLAQTQTGPEGNLLTTWQLEIPMRHQQEFIPLQVKLQQDEQPAKSKDDPKETIWRIDLAFDLNPLGPMQVQAQLAQGQISSQIWSERARTAALVEAELEHFRERLTQSGFNIKDLSSSQGHPPQGQRTAIEQHWVNETA